MPNDPDDSVPVIRLQLLPDDQFDHDSRVARATGWEMRVAAILHQAAFPHRERPVRLSDIAPLYLEQAFAVSEDPDLRRDLTAALAR